MLLALGILLTPLVLMVVYVLLLPIFLPGIYSQMVKERNRRLEEFLKLDTFRKRIYWGMAYVAVAILLAILMTVFASR
jgi:hypothetical protein